MLFFFFYIDHLRPYKISAAFSGPFLFQNGDMYFPKQSFTQHLYLTDLTGDLGLSVVPKNKWAVNWEIRQRCLGWSKNIGWGGGYVDWTTELRRISYLLTYISVLVFNIGTWQSQTFVKKEQFKWRSVSVKLSDLFFTSITNFREVSRCMCLWAETAKSQKCHTTWSPTPQRKWQT